MAATIEALKKIASDVSKEAWLRTETLNVILKESDEVSFDSKTGWMILKNESNLKWEIKISIVPVGSRYYLDENQEVQSLFAKVKEVVISSKKCFIDPQLSEGQRIL